MRNYQVIHGFIKIRYQLIRKTMVIERELPISHNIFIFFNINLKNHTKIKKFITKSPPLSHGGTFSKEGSCKELNFFYRL